MLVPLSDLLHQTQQTVSKIKQHLEDDQQYLPSQQHDLLEQSNIEKLTAINEMSRQLKELEGHPEWLSRGNSPDTQKIWVEIEEIMLKTQHLIAVNQKVIGANLSYYAHIFQALNKVIDPDSTLTYEK